jgi:hypothetical protein
LAMAQMLGLWLRRSSIRQINGFKRRLLTTIVQIAMTKLIKLSKYEKINFNSPQMITGLYGLGRKA